MKRAVYVGRNTPPNQAKIGLAYGQTGTVKVIRKPMSWEERGLLKFTPDGETRGRSFFVKKSDVRMEDEKEPSLNPRYGHCPRHPRYRAIRKPRCDCPRCWEMFENR